MPVCGRPGSAFIPHRLLQGQVAASAAPRDSLLSALRVPAAGKWELWRCPSLRHGAPAVLINTLFQCGPQIMYCSCNMVSPEGESQLRRKQATILLRKLPALGGSGRLGVLSSPGRPGVKSLGSGVGDLVDVPALPLPGGCVGCPVPLLLVWLVGTDISVIHWSCCTNPRQLPSLCRSVSSPVKRG